MPPLQRSKGMRMKTLRCDMKEDCINIVTKIDNKGFVYCSDCGSIRKLHTNCRKLRPHELNALKNGKQLKSY
jgi:hypothetical protein